MYRQAEDGIAAALEAGFILADHPEINIRGVINHYLDTGLAVPCAEVHVDVTFRPPSR